MLTYLLIILVILWLLGVVRIPAFSLINIPLLYIGRKAIGLYDILVFALIVWLIRILPSPLREIVAVFLILWLLSFFGLFFLGGLYNLLILILIIGLLLHILGWFY
ncbi:hypothetical protein A3C98_02375 [Candidatus Roizmanbacteria bacterium RIFCSPHIGHO2_02_FULL_37_15]|uniref:Uncharacterized protein n=1 Tax=Candidatus Roizmanbacteria bacterium RIFCSPLOWO2_01_FULL_37_16 TaxID=1802058 RepID=A0A1F7IJH9_9BACT|nr:MAG: hypothetical protein A2859_05495 [Candidatus Roizmanbacteria bacterium RIFCSPHIGHO2_01_FULL_37_16b]OGK21019.1 MAG: hypothetical protein A3C98_02375 [Candidatus Roizmanbacteria bacterium RIFCSPHIGHO2_02_FULL_37_15]OGK34061.1 MAG: hypothetical protein A3F57_01525 [Candidatus Roizmanbacteria bacterium RIFCSPHIGHO2_12_FULL_36_11]OGK43513.1 MAG: hypothetical protein A3B40_04470 [Candidatus Roizmanbacteria bacterium RIFCSPLOWO2_01_FULL_37_16]OGK56543.1 MAG: hypothetical protein A3I50_04215 [C